MSERISGLTIGLSVDDAGVRRSVSAIKDSFREVRSSARVNLNNIKFDNKSVTGYKKHVDELSKTFDAQKRNVDDLKSEYDLLTAAGKENTQEGQRLRTEYNKQADELNRLGHQLSEAKDGLHDMYVESSVFTKIGDSMTVAGDHIQGFGRGVRDIGSNLTRWITVPALGIATAAGGITAAFGWNRLVGLDTAQAQLRGLGYDTEDVGRISEQVTSAIEGGMTTMGEGVSIAAGAMAAGVEEGAELEKFIKLVGDAAVGSNRPVNEMATIFNRVQGQGKLMTQELNQIEDGMPGFSLAMAEHLGVGLEEFRKMVTESKVSSDDFLTVMDDFAGGMAEAYADSWQGMVANTKAYIGIIGENLLSGVFEQSKESIAEFIELLSSEEAQQWAADMGEKIGAAFSQIINWVKQGINWFMNLEGSQQRLIGILGAVAVAAGPLLTALGSMIIFVGSVVSAIAPLFTALGGLAGGFKVVMTGIKPFAAVFPKLAGFIGLLTGPIGITIGVLVGLGAAFTAAYAKSEWFRGIINGLVQSFIGFIPTIVEFAQTIYNNFINFITPAVISVRDFFIDMFQKIKQFWESDGAQVMEAIRNAIDIIHGIISAVMPVIVSIIRGAFQTVLFVVTLIWENIKGVINGGLNIIMGIIQVFSGLFTGDFSKMWEGVKNIFAGAIEFVWNLFQLMFWGRLIKGITSLVQGGLALFRNFGGGIGNIFTNIWQTGLNIFNSLRAGLVNIWNGINNAILAVVRGLLNGIRGAFTGIFNVTRTIFTGVRNFLSTIWNGIRNTVTSIAQGLVSRLQTNWNTFSSFTTSIFNGVRNFLVAVWNAIRNRVVNTAQGLWNSVRGIWNTLRNVTTTVFNAVRNFLTTVWNAIRTRVTNAVSQLWNRVRSIWNTFRSVTSSIFNAIRNFMINLWNNLTNRTTSIINIWWRGVQRVWNIFRSTTTRIFNGIRNTMVSIWNVIRNTVSNTVQNLWSRVQNTWNTFRNVTRNIFNGLRSTLVNTWNTIRNRLTGIASDIWNRVRRTFNNMKNGLVNIIDGIKDNIDGMVNGVKKGLNKLIDGVNWVADKIGMKELPKLKLSTGTQTVNRQVKTTYDGRLKNDTIATVGDRGRGNGPGGYRNELIQYPNGKTVLTPNTDTTAYLPAGSRVINGRDTHAIMNQPRFALGTIKNGLSNAGEWVGNKASQAWDGAKAVGSKVADVVGDVWDYATNPGKLVDKVLESFGVSLSAFNLGGAPLVNDMFGAMFKKLKDSVKDLFTGWLDDSGGGDGSSFTKFRVTTPYSPNKPVPGYPKAFNNGHHYGIDYATPTGTTLDATNSGTVSSINDRGGGLVARLVTGQFTQFFMHLSKIMKKGKVQQGDAFAKTGNSGQWTTGAHLHYQVEKGNSRHVTNKNTVDPDKYLAGNSSEEGGGKWDSQVKQALRLNNLPVTAPYINAWKKQIQTESSGNPNAVQQIIDVNSGGNEARGLVQVIPPTFNAYKLPGMGSIMNPLHNLAAGMNYAKNRYGTTGMLNRIGKGIGYARGGLLEKEGFFYGAEGDNEEMVIPLNRPTEAMKLLAIAAKKMGGQGKQTSQLPNPTGGNKNHEEMMMKMQQQIDLLTQLVTSNKAIENKDYRPEININDLNKKQNRFNDDRTILI